jgi:predicted DNA-binding transcriptional regulator YafY
MRDGLTVHEIRQRLREMGCKVPSARTIERDLAEMSVWTELGLEKHGSGGREAAKWLLAHNQFRAQRMSLSAALVVKLGLEHLCPLMPPDDFNELANMEDRASAAIARQGNVAVGSRPWTRKIRALPEGYRTRAPTLDEDIRRKVYAALAADQLMRIQYDRPDGTRAEHVCHPLAILIRRDKAQLVVHADNGRAPYVLNLHRMHEVEALPGCVVEPPGWNLDVWIAAGHPDTRVDEAGPTRIRLRVDPGLMQYWRDNPMARGQTVTPEAGTQTYILEFDAVQTLALRQHLLRHGAQLEVLAPDSLRNWIIDQAADISARYRSF